MAQSTITLELSPQESPRVRELLTENGFVFSDAPYAFFRAKSPSGTITFYQKGKVVIQGQESPTWALLIGGEQPDRFAEALALHPSPPPPCWIGIDETGKGDYFGPLVVVAAMVDRERLDLIRELGVADSKKLADKRALELAKELKTFVPFAKVVIHPPRYNPLYAKIGNLNKLLAWGHARSLEDLLEAQPHCGYAISDQFARDERVVQRALMERGRQIQFDQRTKAESDPAVAAASILARAEFLWQMRRLEREAGQRLPKGAGPPVLAAARELVAKQGEEVLGRYAKLHFSTTQQIGAMQGQ